MDFAKILAKIDSIDSKQKLNESLKTEAKGAKPDFLDLDKDGNRKESMKKAAADAKSKKTKKVKEDVIDEESLDEVSAPGQEEWIKSNKDRFIKQYGKKKGNRILYATAWKRSKQQKESAQLEECYSQEMSQSDDRSGMSINSSLDTRTGTKTLTVSAEGAAADQLAQILKLSGMASPHGAHMDKEIELEEYANEPNPHTQGIEVQLQQGNDLNRPKKMTPHGYRNGDNPLAMDVSEQAEIDALVQSLSEELDAIKVDRSKIPAYKRKQKGGDWKTTQQDLERERERNISGPEGLAKLKQQQGVAEGLNPEQKAKLEDLIDQYRTATDPDDYYNDEGSDPEAVLDQIRQEFGEKIASELESGADKMHFGRGDIHQRADPLAWKKPVARITKAGKMYKQDSDYMKNTIKSRYKNSGKSATEGVAKGKK